MSPAHSSRECDSVIIGNTSATAEGQGSKYLLILHILSPHSTSGETHEEMQLPFESLCALLPFSQIYVNRTLQYLYKHNKSPAICLRRITQTQKRVC